MEVEARLKELGLTLPTPPQPVGAYLLAQQVGDLLFLSGTTCYVDGKLLYAPYRVVRFIPTGGINLQNFADYLKLPMVHACGGSWLAPAKLISAGAFDEITRLTREAVDIGCQHRGQGGAR